MKALSARLKRIETSHPSPASQYTREELHVARLLLLRAIARRPRHLDRAEQATMLAEKLSHEIRDTVRRQSTAQFAEHVSSYVQPIWQARFGSREFLPSVVGSEYDDWEMPNLFRRRRAIRREPIVIELIGDTVPGPASGQDYVIPWNRVIAAVMSACGAGAHRDE